jgi:hypothetical protein
MKVLGTSLSSKQKWTVWTVRLLLLPGAEAFCKVNAVCRKAPVKWLEDLVAI